MNRRQPLEKEASFDFIDPLAYEFFKNRDDFVGFGIVHPTRSNVCTSLLGSDEYEVFPTDGDLLLKAYQATSEHFKHFDKRFRVLHWKGVTVDPTTSSGYPFKIAKAKALQKFWPYFQHYSTLAAGDRPIPIWTVNPKVEYLEKDKILKNKIRLFRNPPLDFLIAEKQFLEPQDSLLNSCDRSTWSGLGLTKEYGGWDKMIRELLRFGKNFFRWDVQFWDKRFSPRLFEIVKHLRLRWFETISPEERDLFDWIYEQVQYAYELLPNGRVISTGIDQKSGREGTSSDNTIAHIFIIFVHLVRVLDNKFSYVDVMRNICLYVYSDDLQGSCSDSYVFVFSEIEVRKTFEMFGFGIQEYVMSQDVMSVQFLGASNCRFKNYYVPRYNSARMMYALLHLGGNISDVERCQRVSGLAHNVAFDRDVANVMIDYCHFLVHKKRWVGAPVLDEGQLRAAYLPVGAGGGWIKNSSLFLYSRQESMSVRRSDMLVERLVRDRVLTKSGKEWLVAALDPFHDTEIKCDGYPDTDVAASVLQVVKQTTNISAPTGISGNWDCMIFSEPVWSGVAMGQYSPGPGNILKSTGTVGQQIGPINYIAEASGIDSFTVDKAVAIHSLQNYSSGVGRIVAAGFEVVNTTAELYKQGQAIAFRVPQPVEVDETYQISAGTPAAFVGSGSLRVLNNPPSTAENVMLLSGSKQWPAAEGAYIPLTLNSPDLPSQAAPTTGVLFNTPLPSGNLVATTSQLDATSGCYYFNTPQKHASFHTGGVLFQGLSNQSTLQVTSTFFIERFPSTENPLDKDLVVLAKPSPEYDLVAQELYSQCIATMPVGVMQKENGLGDWFRGVISKVSDVVAPVLGIIPHPVAQGAAMVVRTAGKIAKGKPAKKAAKALEAYQNPNGNVMSPEDMRAARLERRRAKRMAKKMALVQAQVGG